MPKYMLMSESLPLEGQEEAHSEWAVRQHIPDLFQIDGFVWAQRFEVRGAPGERPTHLHVYEIDTPDIDALMATIMRRRAEGKLPAATTSDPSRARNMILTPLTEKIYRDPKARPSS